MLFLAVLCALCVAAQLFIAEFLIPLFRTHTRTTTITPSKMPDASTNKGAPKHKSNTRPLNQKACLDGAAL